MYLKTDGSVRLSDNALDPAPVFFKNPRSEFVEAYEMVKRVTGAYPDLKTLFEELLRDDGFKPAKRLCSPMPHIPELIEVSIWDNWMGDKPVKGQPHRFGVNIKAWTTTDVDFRKLDSVDWSGRVSLMSPTALRKASAKAQTTKGQTYPISPEYAAMIDDACGMMEDRGLAGGMIVTKPYGEGTLRHDRQMMIVDTAAILAGDVAATAVIWVDDETPIMLPAWSTTDAAGKPLPESVDPKTGKHSTCVMQVRYARDADRFHGWISGRA